MDLIVEADGTPVQDMFNAFPRESGAGPACRSDGILLRLQLIGTLLREATDLAGAHFTDEDRRLLSHAAREVAMTATGLIDALEKPQAVGAACGG